MCTEHAHKKIRLSKGLEPHPEMKNREHLLGVAPPPPSARNLQGFFLSICPDSHLLWDSLVGHYQSALVYFRVATQKVLLRGPETSKVPKVVRRGCKRCFGPREQRSPKSLLHHRNPVLHRCNSLLHQCKRTLAPLAQKTFCTLS